MHLFLCYSRVDGGDFALDLFNQLRAGPPPYDVWLDERSLRPDGDWDAQIARAIRDCRALLFVMTRDSVQELSNCKHEWVRAMDDRRPIIALRVHPDARPPLRLGSHQLIDFADFHGGLAELRKHLAFADTPAGKARELHQQIEYAEWDMRKAGVAEQARLRREIDERNKQIADLLTTSTTSARPVEDAGSRRSGGPDDSRARILELPGNNLPQFADTFLGRGDLLESCRVVVAESPSPWLTLTGPPGAGKSRFALELARTLLDRFDDHVYFVDLSRVAEPNLVAAAISQALPVTTGDPALGALRELFRGQRVLLVMDDFERVPTAAPIVAELSRDSGGLRVVATSRGALHIPGEIERELRPLDRGQAIDLFVERAPIGAEVRADDPAVGQLCDRLDCLPLAVELVAAHTDVYPPLRLLSLVRKSLLDMPTVMQGTHTKHQSLRAAVDWSYRELKEPEQALFRRLSVFVDGWTTDTAADVLGYSDPWGVGTSMRLLLDRRLIRRQPDQAHRFDMLQILHDYASEHFQPQDKADLTERHAAYFLSRAEQFAADLEGADQESALGRFDVEKGNLYAALTFFVDRKKVHAALRLGAALGDYWWSRNLSDGWDRLSEILSLSAPGDAVLRAPVLAAAGRLALRLGKLVEATALHEDGLALALRLRRPDLEAEALSDLALVLLERGEFDSARSYLVRAEPLWADDPRGAADTLDNLGNVATAVGAYGQALDYLRRSLDAYPPTDQLRRAWVHNDLARVALLRGELEQAGLHAGLAYDTADQLDEWQLMAWSRNYLGLLSTKTRDFGKARSHFVNSLALVTVRGDKRATVLAVEGLAVLAAEERQWSRVVQLDAATASIRAALGIPRTVAESEILDPAVRRARDELDSMARAQAETAGRSMSLEQAVSFARTS